MPKSFRIQPNSRFDKKAVLWDAVNGGEPPVPVLTDLCFTAEQAGSTLSLALTGGSTSVWSIETSTDGTNWNSYTLGTNITLTNVGDKIYFRGPSTNAINQTVTKYHKFTMTGKIAASGNIMSIMGDITTLTKAYQFTRLFYQCSALTKAPELPANVVSPNCYENMFNKCTSLTDGPTRLPATTLAQKCYYSMFNGCSSLLKAPTIDATTLATDCCSYMFSSCSSLETVPILHARGLLSPCYSRMFQNCSSLKVFSQSGEGRDKEWKIPADGVISGATHTQTDMFLNVITDNVPEYFPGTSGQQFTYYTQNEPV